VSSILSDNFLIKIDLYLQKQSVSDKVISYRTYKSVDMEAVLADMRFLIWCWNHLVEHYDCTLKDIVDENAPLRTKK